MARRREPEGLVELGRITGVWGVRGWVRVQSHTEPRTNILGYRPWHLCRDGHCRPVELTDGRAQGKGIVARLAGVDDRDMAATLVGAVICVPRSALPEPAPGEYYWTDLEDLDVVNRAGVRLGRVVRVMATGANDVLVVADGTTERLVPFVQGRVIQSVDLEAGRIVVDWEPDW